MNNKFTFLKSNNIQYSSFIKTPRELIFGEKYSKISSLAKFLLIIMLERLDLSVKNNWTDKEGNVYIILSHEDAGHYVACSPTKVKKLYAELVANNIITTKKQGLCKPNLIYINGEFLDELSEKTSPESTNAPFLTDLQNPPVQFCENFQESLQKTTNNKNNKYNKNNNTNHINQSKEQHFELMTEERNEYRELIKDITDYNYLIEQNYDKTVLDCIVDTSVNILCTNSPVVRVGKRNIPYEEVKRRIYNLDVNLVENIYENLKGVKSTVTNPTNYLITAIYNASDMSCMGFA